MSKQDRQGVRTAQDLERKYKFGGQEKVIKELISAVAKAEKKIADMITNMNSDKESEIFTTTISIFLEPGEEEITTLKNHFNGSELILDEDKKIYDFDNDGEITSYDLRLVIKAEEGLISLANWSGAVKSDVTITIDMSTPEKFITAKGTNMWGREIELTTSEFFEYIIKEIEYNKCKIEELRTSSQNSGADYIVERNTSGMWTYEKWNSGEVVCYANYEPGEFTINYDDGDGVRCSNDFTVSLPTGLFASAPNYVNITPYCFSEKPYFVSLVYFTKSAIQFRCYTIGSTKKISNDKFLIEVRGSIN